MRMLPALLLPLTLLACACSAKSGSASAGQAAEAQSARFELNTPLFNAAVALPGDAIGAGDFDMNGVPLPPGSTVQGMVVNADARPGQPTLTLRFASPEAPEAVRDWLLPRLREVGYTLTANGTGLTGTTEDGKPFRLSVSSEAGGSLGTLQLSD